MNAADISVASERVDKLRQALRAGDADAVRGLATLLVNDYPDEGMLRELAGSAFLFAGCAAEALPCLPAHAHMDRARALGAVGRFDDARRELDLAEARGDSGVLDTRFAIENLANKAGQFTRRLPHDAAPGEDEMWKAYTEHWRRGEWDAGMTTYRSCTRRFGWLGSEGLPRIGGVCPPWSGEPVDHLLLFSGGGAGDLFQFGRYVPEARARCRRLTLVCEQNLHALMLRALSIDGVVAMHAFCPPLQTANAYQSLGMLLVDVLGARYGTPMQMQPLEGSVPELGDGMHVGLCWSASTAGRNRSVPFAALAPLQFLPGVHFHSLQVGVAADEAAPWVKRHALRSYDDTTSLIAGLDAVVTVDTSVAHLAGNIGKPTHLLLCPYEDWRWGMGDRTPWYPSMRLYRGNLGKAVKDVAERLKP